MNATSDAASKAISIVCFTSTTIERTAWHAMRGNSATLSQPRTRSRFSHDNLSGAAVQTPASRCSHGATGEATKAGKSPSGPWRLHQNPLTFRGEWPKASNRPKKKSLGGCMSEPTDREEKSRRQRTAGCCSTPPLLHRQSSMHQV